MVLIDSIHKNLSVPICAIIFFVVSSNFLFDFYNGILLWYCCISEFLSHSSIFT